MSTIGRTIAAARESVGYTLAELSTRTCIRRPVLTGIESDDFRLCGGDFYARGHIRALCRELGIDPAELLELYDREHAQERTVPAFTDSPVTGRGDGSADARGADAPEPGRERAGSGAQRTDSARSEHSESRPSVPAPRAARGASTASQGGASAAPRGGGSGRAGERTDEARRSGRRRRGAQSPAAGAAGSGAAPRGRHSGSGQEADTEGAQAGAAAQSVPEPRRDRKPSLLSATLAAARRSWPLVVIVAIAGAAVGAALGSWPDLGSGQSAGGLVQREDRPADAVPAPAPSLPGQSRPPQRPEEAQRSQGVQEAQRSQGAQESRQSPEPQESLKSQSAQASRGGQRTGGGADRSADYGTGMRSVTTGERKAEEVRLTVSALDRVWLRVTDAQGDNLYTGVLDKDDVRGWTDPDELRLHVGKASAVRITVNEEHIGRPDSSARIGRFTFSAADLP
ncbi:helix-turn-helix domain-containing protein [Streptomonospora wellingtoniae]|uniref:DUF4115 domain-containing protein n=1 Tax=Streptomonospora wellingtoniae TaxID=3075544 RepID=A0ABU2KSE8_9ACTN|nr:RodZ domain-containing protein [Streptomonospora sp. DSM 45055]MDT0302178.1 DUF4115 domain-containing protein [Streptomonospora sp. DSM 45055]